MEPARNAGPELGPREHEPPYLVRPNSNELLVERWGSMQNFGNLELILCGFIVCKVFVTDKFLILIRWKNRSLYDLHHNSSSTKFPMPFGAVSLVPD